MISLIIFLFVFYVRWNYVVPVSSGIYEEDLPCVGIKLITVRRKLNWSLTFVSSGSECSSQNTLKNEPFSCQKMCVSAKKRKTLKFALNIWLNVVLFQILNAKHLFITRFRKLFNDKDKNNRFYPAQPPLKNKGLPKFKLFDCVILWIKRTETVEQRKSSQPLIGPLYYCHFGHFLWAKKSIIYFPKKPH